MLKFFQNYAVSSAKIWSSVSVLTLVHSRFELILCLDSASVEVPGAPNENIVQNHLNIALLNVF